MAIKARRIVYRWIWKKKEEEAFPSFPPKTATAAVTVGDK
jgi:hypothetical protein